MNIPRDSCLPVSVIGEALIDIVMDERGTPSERVGGSPLNVAVGLGRLGHPVHLLTCLGDDRRAAAIRSHLTESRVAVDAVPTPGGATSTATARIRPDGSADYDFDIRWELPVSAPARPDARIVHTGSLAAALDPGAAAVLGLIEGSRSSAVTTFDPNIRPLLMKQHTDRVRRAERFFALSDVVKLSHEDAEWLYPGSSLDDVADRVLSMGPVLVVITCGAEGSVLSTREHRIDQPADTDGVVDTIGAGDSYMAALLHVLAGLLTEAAAPDLRSGGLLTAPALHALGTFARACATVTVRRAGADLPWTHEVDQVLSRGW